jgi:hypothetical protein
MAPRPTTAARATASPQPTPAVHPAVRHARLDNLVAGAVTERDGQLASIRCCASNPSRRSSRPSGRQVGKLPAYRTAPTGHGALRTASESVLGGDTGLGTSVCVALAAATDVEDHGTLPCRVVTDRRDDRSQARTPTPTGRLGQATELTSSSTPDHTVRASRQALAPRRRSQAEPRDPAGPRAVSAARTPVGAAAAAAASRRHGAGPSQPRARGSPVSRAPPLTGAVR